MTVSMLWHTLVLWVWGVCQGCERWQRPCEFPLLPVCARALRYCALGEAALWWQGGRMALGSDLQMNTSGGLLSEAHGGGWHSTLAIVRQLRSDTGPRQILRAKLLRWGTCWGDAIILGGQS